MGTDLKGWVETREYGVWSGVIRAGHLIWRNASAFAYLFGLDSSHDPYKAEPIAAQRGLPAGLSLEARLDIVTEGTFEFVVPPGTAGSYNSLIHDEEKVKQFFSSRANYSHASYLAFEEIRSLTADQPLQGSPMAISYYLKEQDGTLSYEGLARWDAEFATSHNIPVELLLASRDLPEGTSWTYGELVYKSERPTVGHVLGGDWFLLFDLMNTLASLFKPPNVRLVVWFAS